MHTNKQKGGIWTGSFLLCSAHRVFILEHFDAIGFVTTIVYLRTLTIV
jgi:hypothetical protein